MGLLTVAGRGSDVMNFLRLRDLEQIHASQKNAATGTWCLHYFVIFDSKH
jgi:hypothetical protein